MRSNNRNFQRLMNTTNATGNGIIATPAAAGRPHSFCARLRAGINSLFAGQPAATQNQAEEAKSPSFKSKR